MAVATLACEEHDLFHLGGTKAHGGLARAPAPARALPQWMLRQVGRGSEWDKRAPSDTGIQSTASPCSVLAALVAPVLRFIISSLMAMAVAWPPTSLKPIGPRSRGHHASQVTC